MKEARHTLVAWLFGAAFAAIVILAYSHGHVDRMTSGDGYFYRYVAQHLDANRSNVAPIVAARGPALRYGRIALPALIWLVSLGRSGLMRYAQPIIMIVAAGCIASAAGRLIPRLKPPWVLLPFLALGLTLSIAGGYAEPLSIALLLIAAVGVADKRWALVAIACAVAMLARENSALVVLGMVAWLARRNGRTASLIVATSFVPVIAWHLIVRSRFGHLPLLDPYVAHGSQVLRTPYLSLARGLVRFGPEAAAIAAAHIAVWIVAIAFRKAGLLGWLAVAAGLQLAAIPLLNWHFAGDNLRLLSMMEVLTILAVAARFFDASPRPARDGGVR